MNAVEPRFLVDINAGRLAKWLRVLGYDAVLRPASDDGELVRLAMADRRVLVTRDSRILQRRVVKTGQLRAVLMRSDDPWDQLRQMQQELNLAPSEALSRCIRCNVPLAPVARDSVSHKVPPHVYHTQQEFYACPSCGRIYWPGTHWHNMRRELSRLGGGVA